MMGLRCISVGLVEQPRANCTGTSAIIHLQGEKLWSAGTKCS